MSKFWNNTLPPGYYDKILQSGLSINKGLQANWHNATFLKVRSYIKDTDSHLDYACGSGAFIGNYLYGNSLGIDIANNQVAYAKKQYSSNNYLPLDGFDLTEYQKKYNIITIIGLLEFLDHKESIELLSSLSGLLKKNGEIILTTPNYRSSMYIFYIILNFFGVVDYKQEYKEKYNLRKLKSLINSSNYEVIEVSRFLNIGVFISIWNINSSLKIMRRIEKLINNRFGYLLVARIKKI